VIVIRFGVVGDDSILLLYIFFAKAIAPIMPLKSEKNIDNILLN